MHQESIQDTLRKFAAEREWEQFHSPANLAKSVSIEAAELLECFQWSDDGDVEHVKEELADVLTYAFFLADKLGAEPESLIREKLRKTAAKYPVELARGRSTKYDQL